MNKLFIPLITIILLNLISCENNNEIDYEIISSNNISSTPYSDLQSKYIDKAINYELSLDSKRNAYCIDSFYTVEDKANFLINLHEERENTQLRNTIDESYYKDLYDSLITELNQNEIIKNAIEKSINEDKYTSMILHFEGDSIISKMDIIKKYEESNNLNKRFARISVFAKWGDKIKYRFNGDFPKKDKEILVSAMNEWEIASDNAFIFEEIKNSGWNQFIWGIGFSYHISISYKPNNDTSVSTLGCVPWATISFSKGASKATYLHELGHSLGLIHEHQRPDRDKYIIVKMNKIKSSYYFQYYKILTTICLGEFDINSIMMYSGYDPSASKDPKDPYLITKLNGEKIKNTRTLSITDKLKIKEMYK